MAAATDHPETAAERLIARTILSTWGLWLVGGLYIAGPVLGWVLAGMAARDLYLAPAMPPASRPPGVGSTVAVWLFAMAAMLVILLIGHATNDLGAAQTLKSAIGWAKGWALLALFIFAGAVLPIRAAVIHRAICKLGAQTLLLLPIFIAAPYVGLPGLLYTSPLQVLGGSGPEFFKVILYTLEPGTGVARWQFFAPWSPAAGMVAVVHILCAIEDRRIGWRIIGIMAGVAIALLSQSRLALVAIAVVWPLAQGMAQLRRPALWLAAAPLVLGLGLFATEIMATIGAATDSFNGARADSSRVRAALGRIAVQRWQSEAPIFGHGIVENGPHMVEYMPIGSHHSWYGLLFVKGMAGTLSLAVPMLWSLFATGRMAMRDGAGRMAFAMLLVLWLYSFGENLEVLAYLYWPALVIIGIGLRPRPLQTPAPQA